MTAGTEENVMQAESAGAIEAVVVAMRGDAQNADLQRQACPGFGYPDLKKCRYQDQGD